MVTLAGVVTFPVTTWFWYAAFSAGKPAGMLLFLAPFVLVGAALLTLGVRGLVRGVARGNWVLEIPDSGARPGNSLTATLRPGRKRIVTPDAELTCRLTCLATETSSGGYAAGTAGLQPDQMTTVTLWDQSWSVPAATINPEFGLPISILIPANGAAMKVNSRDGSAVLWQLNIVIPSHGVEHEAMFEIPVH